MGTSNSRQKIGILTFSFSTNPGSVLQAYALQETISKLGNFEPHIINYQKTSAGKPIFGKTVFCEPLRNWTIKKVIKWCAYIVAYPLRVGKYIPFFNKFYKGYPTPVLTTRSDLDNIEQKYDKFVVGSDQVWNFGSYNVDETYFLHFVKDSKKKISYAASLGSFDIPEDMKSTAKKLLSDFDSISVREIYSVDTIKDLIGKPANLVLDPSLLLAKEEYLKIATPPHRKQNYIFLYLREESPSLEKYANELAKHFGLKVIKVLKHWKCNSNGKPCLPLSPLQWLGYMNNANFVVTNSFHGICFSLIFEKQFFVDFLQSVSVATNPRIHSILELFELTDRAISLNANFENISPIDYCKINQIRQTKKQESINYLSNALERNK